MVTTGLKSTSLSSSSRTTKLMACQIRPGTFSPRVPAIASILRRRLDLPDEDERNDQRVNGDSFGEAEADQQRHQDRHDDLGITADGLHGLANAITDPD